MTLSRKLYYLIRGDPGEKLKNYLGSIKTRPKKQCLTSKTLSSCWRSGFPVPNSCAPRPTSCHAGKYDDDDVDDVGDDDDDDVNHEVDNGGDDEVDDDGDDDNHDDGGIDDVYDDDDGVDYDHDFDNDDNVDEDSDKRLFFFAPSGIFFKH